jgi:glycosyltransferase involved in cell wall biosynthesis
VKTFLVDFFVNGHHVEHAGYLGRYLIEHGHEVTFATWGQDKALRPLSNIGVNVCYLGEGQGELASNTLHMIPQFARGLRICRHIAEREDASVVHLLYIDRAVLLPLWWNNFWSTFRAPVFATLFSPYHFLDNPQLSQSERLYHRMVRKALKRLLSTGKLAGLFVVTERIKQTILRSLGLKHLEDRMFVMPDLLPDITYGAGQDSSKVACRKRLQLPPERTICLFFGELRENKGPDVLLKAIKSLPPEVLVVFAGSPAGVFADFDFARKATQERLDGRVRFDLGRVPDEIVPDYFGAADAIVLPYRRSFLATSGILQWAAAAGKPVIATDVGEIGDLIKTYGLGLVIEPEDPRRLAEAIRQYVLERETIENSVKQCASVYSSLNHWRRAASSVLSAYERAVPHFRLQ